MPATATVRPEAPAPLTVPAMVAPLPPADDGAVGELFSPLAPHPAAASENQKRHRPSHQIEPAHGTHLGLSESKFRSMTQQAVHSRDGIGWRGSRLDKSFQQTGQIGCTRRRPLSRDAMRIR